MRNDKCPHCGRKLKAHRNHDRAFEELDDTQQVKSIRMAAINLRRAIRVWALEDRSERDAKTIEVLQILIRYR
jgi:hypothetical protein